MLPCLVTHLFKIIRKLSIDSVWNNNCQSTTKKGYNGKDVHVEGW